MGAIPPWDRQHKAGDERANLFAGRNVARVAAAVNFTVRATFDIGERPRDGTLICLITADKPDRMAQHQPMLN